MAKGLVEYIGNYCTSQLYTVCDCFITENCIEMTQKFVPVKWQNVENGSGVMNTFEGH